MLLPVLVAVLSAAPAPVRVLVFSTDPAVGTALTDSLRRSGFTIVPSQPASDKPTRSADVKAADILIRAHAIPASDKVEMWLTAARLPSGSILLARKSPIAGELSATNGALVQATDEYAGSLLAAFRAPVTRFTVTIQEVRDFLSMDQLTRALVAAGAEVSATSLDRGTATFSVQHPRGPEGLKVAKLKAGRRRVVVVSRTAESLNLRLSK